MKKILLSMCLIATASLFTACDDDKDDDPKVANEFTVDGNDHALASGYADFSIIQTVDDKTYNFWNIALVSSGITYESGSSAFVGSGDAVRFDVYSTAEGVLPEGTYTAGGTDNGIEDAMIFVGVNLETGTGTIYNNEISDGEVVVSKSGDDHVIDFTFTLEDDRQIKGSFKGKLIEVESF
jgi:hypothetical protein